MVACVPRALTSTSGATFNFSTANSARFARRPTGCSTELVRSQKRNNALNRTTRLRLARVRNETPASRYAGTVPHT